MENVAAIDAARTHTAGYHWVVEGHAVKRADLPTLIPSLGQGVVVGRVLAAAVCRSDIKEVHGTRSGLQTFGHEVVVEVSSSWAPAPRTLAFASGDRVILNPHGKIKRSSGFGTHFRAVGDVAELDRSLIRLPSSVDTLRGVFIEPLACATSCVRVATADLRQPAEVLVNGAGLMGVFIASLLAAKGYPTVLTNRSAPRLSWAANAVDPAVLVLPRAQAVRRQFDLIVDASAMYDENTCSALLDTLRTNGRYHVFAGTDPDARYRGTSVDDIRRNELVHTVEGGSRFFQLTGSHRIRDEDFKESIRLVSTDGLRVDYTRLVARRVYLDDLPGVFANEGAAGRTLVVPALRRDPQGER